MKKKKNELVLTAEEKLIIREHRQNDSDRKKINKLKQRAFKLLEKLRDLEAQCYELPDGEFFSVTIPCVESWEDL